SVGEKWGSFTTQEWTDLLPFPFAFRFYDQTWHEAYVSVVGGIRFGRERIYQDLEYRYGSVPGILPLYPAQANWPLKEGRVFLNANADKVTITWRQAAEDFSTVGTYTFQLTLYPSGVFEITHDKITDVKSRIFWTIAVIAGNPTRVPRQVNLIDGVPINGGAEGMVHDDYIVFRAYLHHMLSPLAWLLIGSVLLFVIGLPLFLHFNLVKPLNALLDGVRQVNAGNLQVAMPIHFQDEIGFLTESFNKMVVELRASINELEARVEKRTADLATVNARLRSEIVERQQAEEALRKVGDELAVLYDVSAIANRAVSLDSMLFESLARVMAVIRGDAGVVFLLSDVEGGDGQPVWRLAAHYGIAPEMAMMMDSSSAKRDLLNWFAENREPLLIADAAADDHIPQAMRHAGPLSLLVAPLHDDEQVFGILAVARRGGQSFNAEEIALLSSLANPLGVALHRDHLRRVTQQAKILEDRQNLTRNLHDTVTQLLYALVVFTEVGQTQIESGDIKSALPTFARIGDTARQALKEMRFFIHQMRPSLLASEGLVSALHMRLEAVEERSGIRTHLLADENLRLPLAIENELYAITIEALNNALRHAQANTVTVIVSRNEKEIVLEIADNGCGFDAATAGKGGMGLITMRERVVSLGGDLTISSSRESGTRIRVRVESK
ncbi:MAG: GAF domain-containing protein, partial [Chloroflexi bacterium]|nr:GAF domain-containing protein [Chloroflexota bacterium]